MTTALGLRAGPPGITPFGFPATECPARVSALGDRREIGAWQNSTLPEKAESDHPAQAISARIEGEQIDEPALS